VRAFLRLACARLSQARTGDLQKECCTNLGNRPYMANNSAGTKLGAASVGPR